jgi:hypothetical protein
MAEKKEVQEGMETVIFVILTGAAKGDPDGTAHGSHSAHICYLTWHLTPLLLQRQRYFLSFNESSHLG